MAADIDAVFGTVLVVCGIAFVVVQGIAWVLLFARYGAKGNESASYWHDNPKAEAILLIGTAVILTVLVFMGQRVLGLDLFFRSAAERSGRRGDGSAIQLGLSLSGVDGAFGRQDTSLITSTNDIGLDRNDPPAKDDIVSLNNFHIPVNRPVVVRLRSKDRHS